MVVYRIKVQSPLGVLLGEFDEFKDLKYNIRLNNYGECSFAVPISSDKLNSLVSLRRNTVWIYREDAGVTTLEWAGEMAYSDGILTDNGAGWVTLISFSWLEQFKDRYTLAEKIFTGEDAGVIAWTLIDDTQAETNGGFGVTEGTITATMDRDRTYNNQNVMEAIINLANVISGFDFEITHNKVFNVYDVKGTDKTASIILEYGVNIKSCRIIRDFVNPANRAIVLGQAVDSTSLERVEVDDAALQAQYKLRESSISEMDITEIATFTDKGEALIRKQGRALTKVNFDLVGNNINISQLAVGDSVQLKIVKGIYNINYAFRVYEMQVSYDANNVETLNLTLGSFIT